MSTDLKELKPTLEEVDALIKRDEKVIATWKSNPGYARGVQIELCGLHLIRQILTLADKIEHKDVCSCGVYCQDLHNCRYLNDTKADH